MSQNRQMRERDYIRDMMNRNCQIRGIFQIYDEPESPSEVGMFMIHAETHSPK